MADYTAVKDAALQIIGPGVYQSRGWIDLPQLLQANKNILQYLSMYILLADATLVLHALWIFFIVGGLFLILIGSFLHWNLTKNFRLRAIHLAAIFFVIVQSWLRITCPLTTLEMYFREKAGLQVYQETFIAHWLHRLIFYEAPFWVFSVSYTLFGLLVLLTWLLIPPRLPWK